MEIYECGHEKQEDKEKCELCKPLFEKQSIDALIYADDVSRYILNRLTTVDEKLDNLPDLIRQVTKSTILEVDQEKAEIRKEKILKLIDLGKKSGLITVGAAFIELVRFLITL